MEVINQFKLQVIEYYENIKNTIDMKAQTRLMEPSRISSDNKNTELILSTAEALTKQCDMNLKSCINSINSNLTKSLESETEIENLYSTLLTHDCVFIEDIESKLKIIIRNGIGLLIVSDWYMNANEKRFIDRLFSYGDRETVPVEDERDLIDNNNDMISTESIEELGFELTDNLILIKHAYDYFESLEYQKKPNILDMRKNILMSHSIKTSKFSLSGFQFKFIEQNAFANFKCITHLFLSGNKIESLTTNLFKQGLDNLKTLDLFGCSIKTIEANCFSGLSNLLNLNLGHNSQIR